MAVEITNLEQSGENWNARAPVTTGCEDEDGICARRIEENSLTRLTVIFPSYKPCKSSFGTYNVIAYRILKRKELALVKIRDSQPFAIVRYFMSNDVRVDRKFHVEDPFPPSFLCREVVVVVGLQPIKVLWLFLLLTFGLYLPDRDASFEGARDQSSTSRHTNDALGYESSLPVVCLLKGRLEAGFERVGDLDYSARRQCSRSEDEGHIEST